MDLFSFLYETDNHCILDEFEFWPDTNSRGVSCPWVFEKSILGIETLKRLHFIFVSIRFILVSDKAIISCNTLNLGHTQPDCSVSCPRVFSIIIMPFRPLGYLVTLQHFMLTRLFHSMIRKPIQVILNGSFETIQTENTYLKLQIYIMDCPYIIINPAIICGM